jgi:hypothetical protein
VHALGAGALRRDQHFFAGVSSSWPSVPVLVADEEADARRLGANQ